MKIKINVKNSAISFSDQEIDLKYKGVYFVTGPNGVGKTTILKNIVFTPAFKENNRNYFSYAEQDPEKYDIKIKDYLHRLNSNINNELLEELLKRFELTHFKMNSKLNDVSGGELIKLNIIACLIKETEFVFLDEPTNNLDDKSVENLKDVIVSMSKDKTFIIVSHDPRLNIERHHNILVEKSYISVEYFNQSSNLTENNNSPAMYPCKYPTSKVICRHILRPSTLFSCFLLIIYAALFFIVNHIVFLSFYNSDEIAQDNDSILVYSVDMEYGELSQKYADSQSISIDEANYYSTIQYSDIPDIVKKNNLKEVFLEDYIFTDNIEQLIYENKLSSNPPVIAIPQIVRENYIYQINSLFSNDYLIKGKYPDDNKNEIVLSKNIIDKNYTGAEINDIIDFKGTSYTLVGIHIMDAYIVSYDGTNSYLYRYDEKTYEEYMSKQMAYKKKINMVQSYIAQPDYIIMIAQKGEEKRLIHKLFTAFPANNYRSHSYDKDMADYSNIKLLRITLFFNVTIGMLLGLLMVLVSRKRCMLYKAEAESFDNYYLSKPLTSRIMAFSELTIYLIAYILYFVSIHSLTDCGLEKLVECIGFFVVLAICVIRHLIIFIRKND